MDCSASNGVNSNCQWQFTTASGTPVISIAPLTGPVLSPTSVKVTGSGFAPISIVTITFDGTTVASTTTDSVGSFTANFKVPPSASIGDHTVKATQESNSASQTFKVTSSLTALPLHLSQPMEQLVHR